MPLEPGKPSQLSFLSSNKQDIREDLKYSKEDILAVEDWVKVSPTQSRFCLPLDPY